jgi:undecaprenyl-diphosphatase
MVLRRPRRAAARRLVPAWRRFAPYAIPLAAAVAAAMAWLDMPTMRAALELPRGFLDLVNWASDFGRGVWPLTPLAILLLACPIVCLPRLGFMSRGVITVAAARLLYMFAAVALTGLADSILKRIIGRVRPSELGPFAFEPFSWRPEYASFPSGHTTNVFATLTAVGLIFPRARPVLWVYALGIAASRVIGTAHFVSDVLAGAAFGVFGAIIVRDWFAARGIAFFVAQDGSVHPMPGPSFGRIKRVVRALFGG